jgi:hypothetical protein
MWQPAILEVFGDDGLGVERGNRVPAVRQVAQRIESGPDKEFYACRLCLIDDCDDQESVNNGLREV